MNQLSKSAESLPMRQARQQREQKRYSLLTLLGGCHRSHHPGARHRQPARLAATKARQRYSPVHRLVVTIDSRFNGILCVTENNISE
jgi:hypothetical protein